MLKFKHLVKAGFHSLSRVSKAILAIWVGLVFYALYHLAICVSKPREPTDAFQSSYALHNCSYLLLAMTVIWGIAEWRKPSRTERESDSSGERLRPLVASQLCIALLLLMSSYLFVRMQKHDFYGDVWLGRVYTISFNNFTHREYQWAIEDAVDLDVSSSSRISYCAMTSRDSGSYQLWRLQLDNYQWEDFKEGNVEIVVGSSSLPLELQPVQQWEKQINFSSQSIGCSWWSPPPSSPQLKMFGWIDQNDVCRGICLYDITSATAWIGF